MVPRNVPGTVWPDVVEVVNRPLFEAGTPVCVSISAPKPLAAVEGSCPSTLEGTVMLPLSAVVVQTKTTELKVGLAAVLSDLGPPEAPVTCTISEPPPDQEMVRLELRLTVAGKVVGEVSVKDACTAVLAVKDFTPVPPAPLRV